MSYNVGQTPVGPVQGPGAAGQKPGVPTKPTKGPDAKGDVVAGDTGIKPQGSSATVPAGHVPPSGGAQTPPGAIAAAAAKKMNPEKKFMSELKTFGEEIHALLADKNVTVGSLQAGINRVKEKQTALQESIKKYGGADGKPAKFSKDNLVEMALQEERLFPTFLFKLDEKKTEVEQKNAREAEKARLAAAPPLTAREENLKNLAKEMSGLFHSALVTKNSSPEELRSVLPKLREAQQKLVDAEKEGPLPSNLEACKLDFADRIEKGEALLKEHAALPESIRQLTSDVRAFKNRLSDASVDELPKLKNDLAAMATRIQKSLEEFNELPEDTVNFLQKQMQFFQDVAKIYSK